MRLGVDFRGAQAGESGLRGIGRYTLEMLKGIFEFAPEIEVTLFVKHNSEIPNELKGKCKTVPVKAMSWTDPNDALWTKIPKVRSLEALHAQRFKKSVAEQTEAMEKALRENPIEILHIPSALDIGSYPIYNYPCPVIMTFLDAIVIKEKETIYNRLRGFQQIYYREQAENLKKATRIVAISQASAMDAVEVFGLDASKVDVVYPAVALEYGIPHSRPALVGDPYFLFCSVPDAHKNPYVVLEAFAKVPSEYQLVFVSPSESEFVPGLRQRAEKLGLADRFVVTGYVDEADLYGLFQHATALVSPSKIEGFGLPVAQAMRAGTPVVTSKFSAQGEIAAGVGYLVDPNSIDEVTQAMLEIIKDGRQPDRVVVGKERAKLFDAEKVTHELIDCYREAL